MTNNCPDCCKPITANGCGCKLFPTAAKPFEKHDEKKPRVDLLPPLALLRIADVLGFGALKYAPGNWSKAPTRDRYVAAAIRHLLAYQAGEDLDAESGLHHLAHAGCCILFALEMQLRGWGADERLTAPTAGASGPDVQLALEAIANGREVFSGVDRAGEVLDYVQELVKLWASGNTAGRSKAVDTSKRSEVANG